MHRLFSVAPDACMGRPVQVRTHLMELGRYFKVRLHCLCPVFPLPSWLRHCRCPVFPLSSWLRYCLCLAVRQGRQLTSAGRARQHRSITPANLILDVLGLPSLCQNRSRAGPEPVSVLVSCRHECAAHWARPSTFHAERLPMALITSDCDAMRSLDI